MQVAFKSSYEHSFRLLYFESLDRIIQHVCIISLPYEEVDTTVRNSERIRCASPDILSMVRNEHYTNGSRRTSTY